MNGQTTKPVATANRPKGVKRYRITNKPTPIREKQVIKQAKEGKHVVLLRNELGHVLRTNRLRQNRTLREVSAAARVSLGYLSEVERGQKEASSELLASICEALHTPLSETLREVSDRLAVHETGWVPDTPEALFDSQLTTVA
jgi:predicted transcriptional regulator